MDIYFPVIKSNFNDVKADLYTIACNNQQIGMEMLLPKCLAAFDFDYTIVSQNSDLVARELIPETYSMPDHVTQLYEMQNGWTQFMAEIFQILQQLHISKNNILTAIKNIPEVNGMLDLMRNLIDMNFEVIIISDSNSEFIQSWCEAHEIWKNISAVYTNPATFDENDLLTIRPYHNQTTCTLSEMNLCKGMVLKEHIQKNVANGISNDKVFYIGDGKNDYCPVTTLTSMDVGCARKGFKLEVMLEQSDIVKADTILWEDGIDLYLKIKEKCEAFK